MYNFCPNCGTENTEDKHNFKCTHCNKSFFTNSRPTSSIIPVYKNEVLLGIRARDPGIGKYDIIGGFLENGEEPILGGVRELNEETGITCQPSELEYFGVWMSDEYIYQGEQVYTLNLIYILKLDHKPDMKAADDLESLEWVQIDSELDFAFKYYPILFKDLKKILAEEL